MKTALCSPLALAFAVLGLSACSAGSNEPGANDPGGGGTPGATGGAPNTGGGILPGGTGSSTGSGGFPDLPVNSGGKSSGAGGGGIDDIRQDSCAANTARTEALPSVLELVVDTSGSMRQGAPGQLFQTKWDVTREALRSAINQLPASTGIGVMYFPEKSADASQQISPGVWQTRPVDVCLDLKNQVGIDLAGAVGSPHRARVLQSLDAPGRPNGGTPTHDAYKIGVNTISQTTLPGNRFVVLITDGQPTYAEGCAGTGRQQDANDPRPIIDSARAAAQQGVRTFVIGSPGSEEANAAGFPEARTWLSMMATAGGTAVPNCSDNGPTFCHFDMTQQTDFSKALQDTLKLIVGTVVGCSYPIPPSSSGTLDKEKVNVFFTPSSGTPAVILKHTGTGPCLDGWQYSADGNSVELCPNTCEIVRKDPSPQLDVIFGCKTRTPT
jgi:hypothetical protein